MMRDNCDFLAALRTLLTQYNIPLPEGSKIEPKVEFSSNVTESLDFWQVDFFDEIKSRKIIQRTFPFYTDDLLKEYNFKEIKQYVNVGKSEKGLYKKTTTATDEFPIFGYDKGDFVKIYQPLAPREIIFCINTVLSGKKSALESFTAGIGFSKRLISV